MATYVGGENITMYNMGSSFKVSDLYQGPGYENHYDLRLQVLELAHL